MYNTTVCVGLAWGDEGKGKVVDYLSPFYDLVVRYAGGPNAGHTLKVGNNKIVLRLIPSGILHTHTVCILGHGMVIDPEVFYEEVKSLEKMGINLNNRLFVSSRAHIILPKHIEEDSIKNGHIGTTKKGIGPSYTDKVSRNGIRVLDLKNIVDKDNISFSNEILDTILKFTHEKTYKLVNNYIRNGKDVLFEGAQGTLLDIDCGTYPYVTSSNSIAGGACTGVGVGPTAITSCIGITKAYVTRVGAGPFPTKVNGNVAKHLQKNGNEYGSVTGRPRDVGWLDLPMLRYAVEVNNVSMLAITKLDVLTGLDEIKVCTCYNLIDNEFTIDSLPEIIYEENYKTFESWNENISQVKNFEDLPKNAKRLVKFLEKELNIPVCLISVGPERNQTIDMIDEAFNSFYKKRYTYNIPSFRGTIDPFI